MRLNRARMAGLENPRGTPAEVTVVTETGNVQGPTRAAAPAGARGTGVKSGQG